MPLVLKPRMTSPRMVLPELPAPSSRPLTPEPAAVPDSWMIGVPAKPGWVVPSMSTASVIVGRADVALMTYGPPPGMLKVIRSGWPLTFGVWFAARIASRREMWPSAPMLAIRAAIEDTSPSTASLVVVTTNKPRLTTRMVTVPVAEPPLESLTV